MVSHRVDDEMGEKRGGGTVLPQWTSVNDNFNLHVRSWMRAVLIGPTRHPGLLESRGWRLKAGEVSFRSLRLRLSC